VSLYLEGLDERTLPLQRPRILAYHLHGNGRPFDFAEPVDLEIIERLDRLLKITTKTERELMIDTSKITADITRQTTILQGVVVATQALNVNNAALVQQVSDLKAAVASNGTPDATTQAALDNLDSLVNANTDIVSGLVPAVTANTNVPADVAATAATAAAQPPPA